MKKGISVIIPCYYSWEYTEECLNSVFQQRNVDTQVICVYNERDNFLPLLKELKKLQNGHKITLVDNSGTNYGAAFARNCGLQYADKDTVMFIDDDDIIGWKPGSSNIDPYYLEYFYYVLSQDNKLAMVTGDVIASNDGIEKTSFKNYSGLPRKRKIQIEHALPFLDERNTSCATLYRTSIINDNDLRFKPNMKYREDTEFIMQYALAAAMTHKHALTPVKWPESNDGLDSYYWYRKHPDSVMGQAMYNSQLRWHNEYKRQKDNLAYRTYLLQVIENHPLREKLLPTYNKMISGWKHTQKSIQNDIDNMVNAGRDIVNWYKTLQQFDSPDETKIPDISKTYLQLFYNPISRETIERLKQLQKQEVSHNKTEQLKTVLCMHNIPGLFKERT